MAVGAQPGAVGEGTDGLDGARRQQLDGLTEQPAESRRRAGSGHGPWCHPGLFVGSYGRGVDSGVTRVVIEATSDYWKCFYFLLEDGPFEVSARERPPHEGDPRQEDRLSHAQWLAELGAHGLGRASLVPPEPIRELRDLTRTRADLVHERAREIQRLEKLLEDAGIKVSSVATDITGVSGRARIEEVTAPFRPLRDLLVSIPASRSESPT